MVLIRWQPMPEMEALRRQMDRVYDEMTQVKQEAQVNWRPAVELQDTEENIILRAQIPGVEAKDLDINVAKAAVAIAGERRYENKDSKNGYIRSEFRYGKFQRVIALPVAVQNDRVKAQFQDGILTLTLPKVTETRRQVVKVNLADTTTATEATTPASDAANQAETTATA